MNADDVADARRLNPRLQFLESIGLAHDPFATPVAEQELKIEEIPPRFYSYFTSPSLAALQDQDIFQWLRASNHAFIYGDPGSGKTTLRLTLEADCRTRVDHTLVVTYNLGDDIPQPLSPEQHWERLARTLAIDLFIQIVEQFDSSQSNPPATTLRQLMNLSHCHLQRVVNRILENPRPDSPAGLGAYWSLVNRPAVRYVPSSPRLLDMLQDALGESPCLPPADGIELVRTGWDIARQWGFTRALVLVDGVDTRQRTVEWMLALVEPLLQSLAHWSEQAIFFKFFLPTELQNYVQDYLANLHLKYIRDRIIWNKDALRELLKERFRAAGSRKVGFDALEGKGLEGKLDELILESASGSPRRMLQIISALIDVHIARAPNEDKFTILDWEKMRQDWAFEPPPPQAAS